ncbi:starch-binding domain-containing protein 1 [Ochotona princeps]|uniref:starch-binding domain-containing protein 1 n=1 Tax=Ochotona princeps TaxID=9978 RepID=UPI0027151F59|nr:starch-binding domain-containing protein 1 [Ochotona princeps]
MGAVWSALLVGGSLAGALFAWLLRGSPGDAGISRGAEPDKEAPARETATPGGRPGGGDSSGLSPGPGKRELDSKAEQYQESNGSLISETRDLGRLQETAWQQQNATGGVHTGSQEPVPSANGSSGSHSGSQSLESPRGEWRFQHEREVLAKAGQQLPSSKTPVDSIEVGVTQLDSQGAADQDWEMVSRHSSWGDIGLGGNLEQGTEGGWNFVEAGGREADVKPGRVVAASAEAQQVSIRFQVHYVTSTDVEFIAVTGDHEHLGRWNTYIPLHCNKDGLWSHSVLLPADTVVQWKFVLVENGGVTRWEECSNRVLETGRGDQVVHRWWGIP